MRTSEATTALITALVKANSAFKPVIRAATGQVGQNREYKYADLAGILDATMPALLAQGLIVLQAVDAESSTLITRLAHVSGEWAEAAYPLKLDLPPQQFGSSLTYGRRYSLQSLLNLASEDDDGQAAQPAPSKTKAKSKAAPLIPLPKGEAITTPQRQRLIIIAKANGWTEDQIKNYLLLHFGSESTRDVPLAKYDAAIAVFEHPPAAQPF
jgi:ERF superfamily